MNGNLGIVFVLVAASLYSTVGWILSCIFTLGYSYNLIRIVAATTPEQQDTVNPAQENVKSNRDPIRPWDVKAYPYLSEIVAELLEDILKRFVHIWYDYISTSPSFMLECKSSLRQGCALFYERIHQAKWPNLVQQTLPKVLSQLSFFIEAVKSGATSEELIRKLPRHDIHPALHSLPSEEAYLKCILNKLAPYLFPHLSQTGAQILSEVLITNAIIPGIEHCSSPIISYKIIIALHHQVKKKFKNHLFDTETDQMVSTWQINQAKRKSSNMKIFLYQFGSRSSVGVDGAVHDFSIFRINHRRLIEDQQMFYNFKCWLQTQNALPLLNFVHAFEDFNRRFFAKAELSSVESAGFYRELSRLIDDYFTAESKNTIPIKSKITDELKSIMYDFEQGEEVCIKASRPLTIAYNTALSLLEEYYIPDFCHGLYADDASLTCGNSAFEHLGARDANSVGGTIQRSASVVSVNSLSVKSLSRRSTRSQRKTPTKIIDDDAQAEYFEETDDLNTLRVTIPRVANDEKGEYAFVVSVENAVEGINSIRQEQLRYYAEFYALENKLKEFHGQLGCNLPIRRMLFRSEEYHVNKRPELESWLQKVLTRPELRHSKLLLDFIMNDSSESFGSNLIESSISLNRLSQPLEKMMLNKKAPRLLER